MTSYALEKYRNKTKYTLDFHSSWSLSLPERPTTLKNHVAKETLNILPSIHPFVHPFIHLSVSSISVSVDWGPVS